MVNDNSSFLVFDSAVESPLVTIAIPTYKRDVLLVEAVLSALHQDINFCFEVLVVDNNPERNDVTEIAMNQFKTNPLVAYYKNEQNLGMNGNFNRLYSLSKGNYVTMLHDDDMLFPCYLKVFMSVLEYTDYKYDLIYPFFHFSRERNLLFENVPESLKFRIMKVEDFAVTQWGIPSGMMISKQGWELAGGFSESFYPIQDQEFIYRALHVLNGCQVYWKVILYYMGTNASMKPEIMKQVIIKEKAINRVMRSDKQNRFRLAAYICYRNQMANIIRWGRNFVDENVLDEAKSIIRLNDSIIMDTISNVFASFFRRYIRMMRFKSFYINESL